MSNISLSVGGRDYLVACAPGEEEHVAYLGRMIDEKLASLPLSVTQGETRALLFAALLLADDLHEARNGQLPPPPPVHPDHQRPDPRLAALAERLENLAAALEGPLEEPGENA